MPCARQPARSRQRNASAIAAWLLQCGVKTVAMESTGVHWIPLFQILETHGLEASLVNARHVGNVPGRPKTDRLDCAWLQTLHACGLLSSSFRPSPEICRVRACLRQRTTLVRRHAANRATQLFRQAASSLTNSACWLGVFYRRMKLRLGGPAP